MDNQSNHLALFSECIPVKGYVRAVFYDLSRNTFQFIPNRLVDILLKGEGLTRNTIQKDNEDVSCTLKEYLDFLEENDFVFYCDKDELSLFPKLPLNWDFPAEISNIFIEEISKKNFNILIKVINYLKTKDIVLKLNNSTSQIELLDFFDKLELSKVKCIDLFINELLNKSIQKKITKYSANYNRIRSIIFYNSSKKHSQIGKNGFGNIIYTKKGIKNEQPFIDKFYFNVNTELFTESQKNHTYFNRKLYIGSNGEIKNAPECKETFGNIQDLKNPEDIKTIIVSPEFQKYWYVHKEITDVCKDCEFRHMCVDNRLPHKRKENEWYHKQECNYNPYIAKWEGEKGYQTLAECGVISNEEGFSIDHERIAKINEELWGE